jgi:hypothetical protein
VRDMTFEEKLLTSQPPVEVAGRRIKRYNSTSGTAPVTADIERAAVELSPLHHERNARVRHILMPGAPDLAGYPADSMPSGHTR